MRIITMMIVFFMIVIRSVVMSVVVMIMIMQQEGACEVDKEAEHRNRNGLGLAFGHLDDEFGVRPWRGQHQDEESQPRELLVHA